MRHVTLTDKQIDRLSTKARFDNNSVTRQRADILLLSHKKYTIKGLCDIFSVSRRTIERLFIDWEKNEYSSLTINKGRGPKVKLRNIENEVKSLVKDNSRNISKIICLIKEKHDIKVCKSTLRTFLKS